MKIDWKAIRKSIWNGLKDALWAFILSIVEKKVDKKDDDNKNKTI